METREGKGSGGGRPCEGQSITTTAATTTTGPARLLLLLLRRRLRLLLHLGARWRSRPGSRPFPGRPLRGPPGPGTRSARSRVGLFFLRGESEKGAEKLPSLSLFFFWFSPRESAPSTKTTTTKQTQESAPPCAAPAAGPLSPGTPGTPGTSSAGWASAGVPCSGSLPRRRWKR